MKRKKKTLIKGDRGIRAATRQSRLIDIEKVAGTSDDQVEADAAVLLGELTEMIDAARAQVSAAANAALVMLNWHIGHRVRTEVLEGRRGEYGAQIVATLSRQLGWSHFVELIPLEPLPREFYAEMCRVERWSVRQLRERIDSMLFERTALSKKPDDLVRQELVALREKGELSPALVFRDPYMLDFLDLADTYSEKDLESAILREIERFLLELGVGFAFVDRQKRITLDGDDYYLDLLFFHRRMQRLIAIELKIGDFKPADSGQMELYLRWLDRHERQPNEQQPLGIVLCAGKKRETVEYLNLDARGIHVAEYLTELPPREVLQERLHRAIEAAKDQLAASSSRDATIDVEPRVVERAKRKSPS
jgi:predicted nuclease of restriction endonuclease-like (RecB) superfamily